MKFASIVILVLVGFGGLVIMQRVYGKNQCDMINVTTPNGQTIVAETARTESEQRQGLSNRQALDSDAGMIFLFSKKDHYTFWMKDTLIPLDIIWIDQSRVVDIKQLKPLSEGSIPRHTPMALADSVLEIPAGMAARYEINIGSQLHWKDPCSQQH